MIQRMQESRLQSCVREQLLAGEGCACECVSALINCMLEPGSSGMGSHGFLPRYCSRRGVLLVRDTLLVREVSYTPALMTAG